MDGTTAALYILGLVFSAGGATLVTTLVTARTSARSTDRRDTVEERRVGLDERKAEVEVWRTAAAFFQQELNDERERHRKEIDDERRRRDDDVTELRKRVNQLVALLQERGVDAPEETDP